jgi:hypothetical protein
MPFTVAEQQFLTDVLLAKYRDTGKDNSIVLGDGKQL